MQLEAFCINSSNTWWANNNVKQQWLFPSLPTSTSTLPTKITISLTLKTSGCGRDEQSIISSRGSSFELCLEQVLSFDIVDLWSMWMLMDRDTDTASSRHQGPASSLKLSRQGCRNWQKLLVVPKQWRANVLDPQHNLATSSDGLHKGKLIDHLSSVLQRLELHQRQLKAELSSVLCHDEASTKGVSFTSLLELSSAVKSLAYDHSLGWKRDALKLHKGQLLGDLSSVFQRLELQCMLQLVTAAVVIPLSFTSLFTAQDSFQSPLSSVFKLGLGQ
ncbi:hypothetical protein F2Q69_00024420 [Brassica cretica]|uniref:Uncharacterized protein n=1 Tax=Brassica cretica TaxID=69181 RepID=A0A8S9Q2L1_BRACR|nr:hypothetical protein F2Q69_00024420 [Brassica cretica]